MAEVNRSGRTFHCMKDTGEIIKPMEGEGLSIPTVMYMKVSGKMTRPMAKECITTMMAPAIMVNGLRMFNKVLAFKSGPMDHLTKGNFLIYFKAASKWTQAW